MEGCSRRNEAEGHHAQDWTEHFEKQWAPGYSHSLTLSLSLFLSLSLSLSCLYRNGPLGLDPRTCMHTNTQLHTNTRARAYLHTPSHTHSMCVNTLNVCMTSCFVYFCALCAREVVLTHSQIPAHAIHMYRFICLHVSVSTCKCQYVYVL